MFRATKRSKKLSPKDLILDLASDVYGDGYSILIRAFEYLVCGNQVWPGHSTRKFDSAT